MFDDFHGLILNGAQVVTTVIQLISRDIAITQLSFDGQLLSTGP